MYRKLACFALIIALASGAPAVDRVVGVTAPEGGATLVKRVHVRAGSEIAHLEMVSNDLTTRFPAVRLRCVSGRSLGEVIAEVLNVSAAANARHRFTVPIPPVVFLEDEEVLIEVVLPPTSGVDVIGTGAGLGANDLAGAAATSYIGNEATGDLQTIDADLCLNLLGPASTGKVGPTSPADLPSDVSSALGLIVRTRLDGDTEVLVTAPSPARVAVQIYDVMGTLVQRLSQGASSPGPVAITWDRTDSDGRRVASGVYFVVARIGDLEAVRKTVVLR